MGRDRNPGGGVLQPRPPRRRREDPVDRRIRRSTWQPTLEHYDSEASSSGGALHPTRQAGPTPCRSDRGVANSSHYDLNERARADLFIDEMLTQRSGAARREPHHPQTGSLVRRRDRPARRVRRRAGRSRIRRHRISRPRCHDRHRARLSRADCDERELLRFHDPRLCREPCLRDPRPRRRPEREQLEHPGRSAPAHRLGIVRARGDHRRTRPLGIPRMHLQPHR